MTTTHPSAHPQAPLRTLVEILLLGAATAGAWFAWFSWDHEYQTDPATGIDSGPYETWQGVGCALTLMAIGAVAVLARLHPVGAALVMTVAFTTAWCVTEMPGDDTGLSGVGAAMVFLGVGTATALWFGLGAAIRSAPR